MKYVIIIGASGGMGSTVARALVDAGYGVIAMDKEAPCIEGASLSVGADVRSETELSEAFERVAAITDRLYAVLHFSGIYMLDSLVEMSEERMLSAYDINLFGVMRINRIFLPLLGEGSRIIITTSELAPLDPLPFTGIYALTKSALDKYAYSLRMELQLLGIHVSVLRPGAVDTGMLGASTRELDDFIQRTELYSCNADRFKRIVDSVEARRIPAERIARVAKKLLETRRPRQTVSINRNPLLLLLNILPDRLATYIIKVILKG